VARLEVVTSPNQNGRLAVDARPAFNTHVHLPPNFSAFSTVEDAVATGAREGVRVMGSSNFHDFGVYARFEAAARASGVAALFGLEFITVLEEQQRLGVKINDPANPGRAYVCGKGIPAPNDPSDATRRRMQLARAMNEARAARLAELMRGLFDEAGLPVEIDAATIVAQVAARAEVPTDWVVLQERHVALGFQELLFERLDVSERSAFLARLYGRPPAAAPDDAVAVQGELRARLMKAGCPAFVEETSIPFDEGLALVLGLDAIPCYPTLADGADPICGYEAPSSALVERVLGHGIPGAELIPIRNTPAVVDEYISVFRDAGLFVLVGTEHNTQERIPLAPACLGGVPLSPRVLDICWEGTCVVAAHQHLRATGQAGFVDGDGRLNPGFPDGEARLRWFAELGEQVIVDAIAEAVR
jgi:hypothetical protein